MNRFDNDKEARKHLTICNKCDRNEIGDEVHYLCKCNFFKDERKKYLGRSVFVNPNIFTIRRIMNCESKIRELVNFFRIVMSTFEIENVNDVFINYNFVYEPYTTRSGREVRRPTRTDL